MSITNAMASGVSGLLANSTAVSSISYNIANADTVGYRRSFEQMVTAGASGASGAMATGVQTTSIHSNTVDGNYLDTAIATNLAVSLADNQSGSVALIDFDLEFGDVALAMDLVPDFSLVDLPSQMERLDPLLLGQYMTLHRSGVRLLAAPMRPG